MLAYKESETGQLLHEGINEAGSMGSFIAAGSAYATQGQPMIPVYVFYSMFGFQRTGDSIWAAGDQMARGFLIGATAGRTTLTGEGLQHNDGHSQLLAATNPAVVAYDPGFSYEVAHIVKDGLRRMYGSQEGDEQGDDVLEGENVIYYLTVYNEPYVQPAEPDDLDVDGLLRGIYRYQASGHDDGPQVRLLASGVALPWAVRARQMLAEQWGVGAEVWSVTSWNELRRDGVEAEHHNLVHPDAEPKVPYVHSALQGEAPRSWPCRTGCARCPTRSASGSRPGSPRWAPTGSACPTPGRRRAATSPSTPSRSPQRRSRRSPRRASWTGRWRSRPRRSTTSTIRRRPVRRRVTRASPEGVLPAERTEVRSVAPPVARTRVTARKTLVIAPRQERSRTVRSPPTPAARLRTVSRPGRGP